MAKAKGGSVNDVLCATDFSESAEAAVRVALDYARAFGARLHLLYVTLPTEDPTVPPVLSKLADICRPTVPVVTAVESGSPAPSIVRYAVRHGIALIVMGTHGRTGVSRALIGSVAERVVRMAPCPVLTVRGPVQEVVSAPEAEIPVHRCLVCAMPTEDLICETCRARIRGEALERKRQAEHAGRR